jgi:hypothetical protein
VKGLSGFRSAVAYVPLSEPGAVATGPISHGYSKTLIAVGPSGTDYSTDDGRTWTRLDGPGFDTLSFAREKAIGWAAGAHGIIGRIVFKSQ